MMDKILALVDGSIYAASVCDHAAWLAGRLGAPVELLHVLGRREAPGEKDLSGAVGLGARSSILEKLATLDEERSKLVAERGRAILDDARALIEKSGLEGVTTRLRHGDLIEEVAAQEGAASLIVIGKRGAAADFAHGHLGSNLERIVRASHRPVVVASRAFRPIAKVLIAYDGGASAARIIDHVATSPIYAGLPVRLVTVGGGAEVLAGLESAGERLRAAGLEAETLQVQGQPDKALGAMVEAEHFDMLVMGAYGHSRVRSLIIGSTTTEMVRSCKVPVVLLR
ncbi:universal stress protein [Frigidibacter sp. ROC022]|uniref:universal stress protein n=1 Tax=Frigidibacter sp. ROC022 TaxID=2971796 RepID=UPI00215A6A09|nr:universal stress protein [Frigidibacter sp. ROC022]